MKLFLELLAGDPKFRKKEDRSHDHIHFLQIMHSDQICVANSPTPNIGEP